jgi:hypothetical protein
MAELDPDVVQTFIYAAAHSVAFGVTKKARNRLKTILGLVTR